MAALTRPTEADIWERIIRPDAPMSKATARKIQALDLSEADHAKVQDLAERNRWGKLSEEENDELDHFLRVGTLLSILKLRARKVLASRTRNS